MKSCWLVKFLPKRKLKPNQLGQVVTLEEYNQMQEAALKNFQLQREASKGLDKD